MIRFSFFLLSLFIFSCSSTQSAGTAKSEKKSKAKNIILLIGDGMGISQISAGMYSNENYLNLEKFKHIGLHKAYASNSLITDSAAGATAFASGVKTYNGAIGVTADTFAVETILEEVEKRGKKTGLISTSTIVHATPASFIAHQPSRQLYEEIAADFLNTDVDYFVGGGIKFFENRSDDINLLKKLEEKGYLATSYYDTEFEEIDLTNVQKFAYLTANEQPLSVEQGRDYLLPVTKQAIKFLNKNNEKGFFLMIEGSQIDWGGHSNNSDYIIKEMIDFDKAIGAAFDFAKRDKETLVVVTADHECGGYSLVDGSQMGSINGAFTTDYHTADLIPVFAYGPGAEQFAGIYENTEIYHKMRKAYGYARKENGYFPN